MKKVLNSLFVALFTLTAALAPATTVDGKQRRRQRVDSRQSERQYFTIPGELRFLFRLEAHPELDKPGSLWECSYKLYIEDFDSFSQRVKQGSGQHVQRGSEVLLRKGSFTFRDLANGAARKTVINIPVPKGGQLFERFSLIKKKPQIVWMSLTVRINDRTSNINIVKDDQMPFWDLRYFVDDPLAKVIMGVSPRRELRWGTVDPPPWAEKKRPGIVPVEKPKT